VAACDAPVNKVGMVCDGVFAQQSAQDIERAIQVNLVSAIYLTKLIFRERLALRMPGVVVVAGSIVAIPGYCVLAVCPAANGALSPFGRSLSREMGAMEFRITTLLPGSIATDMSRRLSESRREQVVRRTPLGRLGTVDNVSPVVRLLLSDGARFISGRQIVADGGLTT